ncbi:contactin-associated protein-like 2 [Stylophora pistillata]|nr:contactin-associated protein-like 2 [Stylophora pistillata]
MYDGTLSLPTGAAVDSSNALIVSSASFSHGGVYTCKATNALSSIQTSVVVYVTDYPKTCTSVKADISDVSGDYFIDPEGALGEDPFPVYCNMTDKEGVGVTVVGHDSENRTQVKGFDKPGEYYLDVHYISASISQLKVLTEASDNCQQFIKYECFQARLVGSGFSWWVSRDGEKMTYWGGANIATGGCACGVTRSCPSSKWRLKCNCDKNDGVWREDSGFLTNKSHLPVVQLRFGDTGDAHLNEEGFHTLGKLECYGMALV